MSNEMINPFSILHLHLAGKNVNIEVKDGVAVLRIDQPDSKV